MLRCRVFMNRLISQYKEDGDFLKLIKTIVMESRFYQTDTQMTALLREIDRAFIDLLIHDEACN